MPARDPSPRRHRKTSWKTDLAADAAVSRLVREGRIESPLIVGIWNGGEQRYAEYHPQKFLALAPEPLRREYVEEAADDRAQAARLPEVLRFLRGRR